MVAQFGMAGMSLYGSSKAWAAEFGPAGVQVNAVSPGPTRTEGTEPMGDQLDQLASAAPAVRPAAPEEIANAIVYLSSDEASFIHGAMLDVDGGPERCLTRLGSQIDLAIGWPAPVRTSDAWAISGRSSGRGTGIGFSNLSKGTCSRMLDQIWMLGSECLIPC
jgi:Enoyl-(Acyl carrier protein) reductase